MAEHVTFFRMKVQPGKLDELKALMSGDEGQRLAGRGWKQTIVGSGKNDPNDVWVAVTWDTSDNYYANAGSPEQDAEYQKTRALLTSDPEWFDCDLLEDSRA